MPYIEHSLGKTFYTARGRSTKKTKPLIWLHGGPGGFHDPCSDLFNLKTSRKIIMYDQIGGGKSSPIESSQMKIDTFVNELDKLISSWQLKEFHLGGGSWGTTLALEYYLRKKGQGVNSLIFQSPMFCAQLWQDDAIKLIKKMPVNDQKIINYCHEINATDSKVYQDTMFKYYLKHVLRDKDKLKDFLKTKNPNGKQVYQHMWGPSEFKASGTLKKYNRVSCLEKITVPTLFICGQYDEATPDSTRMFSTKVKKSQLKVITGASHAIIKEKPEAMIKVIDNFLIKL